MLHASVQGDEVGWGIGVRSISIRKQSKAAPRGGAWSAATDGQSPLLGIIFIISSLGNRGGQPSPDRHDFFFFFFFLLEVLNLRNFLLEVVNLRNSLSQAWLVFASLAVGRPSGPSCGERSGSLRPARCKHRSYAPLLLYIGSPLGVQHMSGATCTHLSDDG